MYRKPTNTDVIINQHSTCPFTWKAGLLKCFLHRAYNICTTWTLFHIEITKLWDIFRKNGYNKSFFDKTVNTFLYQKFHQESKENIENSVSKSNVICLPYIGNESFIFKKKLCRIYKRLGVKIRVVFTSFRVKKLFFFER